MELKILVVEDQPIAQKIAQLILKSLNCQVHKATTGVEALEYVAKQHYDLIFMDLGLRDMDGLTITETIRKTANLNQNTAIVALTAHDDRELEENCIRSGMNSFLSKPLTTEKCKSILAKFTHRKEELLHG